MPVLHIASGDGPHAAFVVLLVIAGFALGFTAAFGILDGRQALGGILGLVGALVVLAFVI